MAMIASLKILTLGGSGNTIHATVGKTIVCSLVAFDAGGHIISPFPSDASTPAWSIDNGNATIVPSGNGLHCNVTGVSAGTSNLTAETDQGANHISTSSQVIIS